MTDKEYSTQKKRVEKLIAKWVKQIGLGWWSITYEWERSLKADPLDSTYKPIDIDGEWTTFMDCRSDPYYRDAYITFYLPACESLSDKRLERCFVHELLHVFLAPMRTKAKHNEEELVATTLADALIWAREAGYDDAKRSKVSTGSSKSARPKKGTHTRKRTTKAKSGSGTGHHGSGHGDTITLGV